MHWPAWRGGRVQLWACAVLLLPLHSMPVFSRLEEGQCAADGGRYDPNDLVSAVRSIAVVGCKKAPRFSGGPAITRGCDGPGPCPCALPLAHGLQHRGPFP